MRSRSTPLLPLYSQPYINILASCCSWFSHVFITRHCLRLFWFFHPLLLHFALNSVVPSRVFAWRLAQCVLSALVILLDRDFFFLCVYMYKLESPFLVVFLRAASILLSLLCTPYDVLSLEREIISWRTQKKDVEQYTGIRRLDFITQLQLMMRLR